MAVKAPIPRGSRKGKLTWSGILIGDGNYVDIEFEDKAGNKVDMEWNPHRGWKPYALLQRSTTPPPPC